ncbi:MAG: hypothetical protein JWM82_454 [Myxococcales bacterium]|nr:hypothetical protein [Myxococcales bacterium]
MKGFLLGLIVAALGFGTYTYWKQRGDARPRPSVSTDAGAFAKESKEKKKRRPHGATRLARNINVGNGGEAHVADDGNGASQGAIPDEPEPLKLSAADLKIVGQGDDLSRPDVVHLDMSDDSGSRELSQDDIDARFRAKEDDILRCIQRARPDEETWVPGRVTVKFRIQRTGTVRGVRVEAPAILQKGGIYGCIKSIVGGIRYPASTGSQVMTYPFSLT